MNICVLASGKGSNFNNILKKISEGFLKSKVVLLISDKPDSYAVQIARENGIPVEIINKDLFPDSKNYEDVFLNFLNEHNIDLIVMAGYIKKLPDSVVDKYEHKIINIHPSLLPAYGGKGMYGMNVHRAVINAGEKHSGITIHYVTRDYDSGEIIFQKTIDVENDDENSLMEKIQALEYKYYPEVIRLFEEGKIKTTLTHPVSG
ncbi:MAG TPA: phosphoribosylglycinamide formyltransferase [Ignavibacteria bacterium]|nr:phosphoribosylglycinamide formyltransferase [Ignavibacteria bacterium]